MIAGLLLLGAAMVLVLLAIRLREPAGRMVGQGVAVLLAAAGVIQLMRRPGSAWHLPGYGPRRWREP